jgi:hypothetical protein
VPKVAMSWAGNWIWGAGSFLKALRARRAFFHLVFSLNLLSTRLSISGQERCGAEPQGKPRFRAGCRW